ncbi:MAG TPA: DEAD/DEAH box helicase [Gaiellaceae bacterium]|nr:DEAD/DEAH box helicase [Gaiellaceae bacterium]
MLELVWHPEAVAFAFARDGAILGDDELDVLDNTYRGRFLSVDELAAWAPDQPLADSASALLHVRELARRAVSEGLVFPQLAEIGGEWHAFWGATLEAKVEQALTAIAAAAPPVIADYFHGDRVATVNDLYPRLVDRIARDRLVAAGVRLGSARPFGRHRAVDAFLHGLTSPEPELPHGPSYAALERNVTRWVDRGFARLTRAPWGVGLHLDERDGRLFLQLWLHASDDASVALPASLLWDAGPDAFRFLRDADPYDDLREAFARIRPELAERGFAFDGEEPRELELDAEDAEYFLRRVLPALSMPVVLPTSWTQRPARIRADLTARATTGALAHFDWRLRVGDLGLDEEELRRLASERAPLVHAEGRWQALRRDDVERALRFLELKTSGGGMVDLVRAASGIAIDEFGLELGEVSLDERLAGMLDGDAKFKPLPTPPGMEHQLYTFQEAGHGWLRLLGDLGIGCVLADDMGLGKTVQAIAMLVSEREQFGRDALGPTLVVCPMSVARQWLHEVERFAPGLRVHLHHGGARLIGDAFVERAHDSDLVITSYDIATRDVETLQRVQWDRLLLDEAQDVKNPQTRRARSLRLLRARRRVAMTGTPIENHLGELWAIMDLLNPGLLGTREWFHRAFVEPIQLDDDPHALERLRAIVRPFILRRQKNDPEVELDLPPITTIKDYCLLTTEQAVLYQQVVDSWLPRVEAHEDRFGRRGAVLAMLGQLKQVCNHPEMVLHEGGPIEGRSGKLERLIDLLRQVPAGDKALVFTQYTSFLGLVDHLAERLGKPVEFFHGGLSAGQREELLTAFATPDGPAVLVVSLRAGGRGLNLPAANHVFHFDRWWNPAVEQQATDRAHRLGQEKPVWVHSLITTGTLEERIDQLLESKRELVEKVMAGTSDDWLGDLDLGAIRAAVALAPDAYEQEVLV